MSFRFVAFTKILRVAHRWAGLATAIFLVVVSLTGSLLAFYSELDGWLAPELRAPLQPNSLRLTAGELAVHAELLEPKIYVTSIYLREIDRIKVRVIARVDPTTVKPYPLDFDELLLNPFTGAELGRRTLGDISQGLHNLMPMIYSLHYELLLGSVGMWILGIIALIWTLDCVVGLIITFPNPASAHSKRQPRSFLKRWSKAWKIKTLAGSRRFNFDLHRALGLWLWLILLIFAWSSVYMNLWDTLYTKTTASVMEYHPPWQELRISENPISIPTRNWQEVNQTATHLMNAEAKQHGFKVIEPMNLRYHAEYGAYLYRVRSSLDMGTRGATDLYFDAQTNAILLRYFPSKQHIGNTVTQWLFALHTAQVFGLPYRIFVVLLGLVISVLSITGVLVWWLRRH